MWVAYYEKNDMYLTYRIIGGAVIFEGVSRSEAYEFDDFDKAELLTLFVNKYYRCNFKLVKLKEDE